MCLSDYSASLKATFIRQAIQRALNRSRLHDDHKLDVPYLLIYQLPTIKRLAEWVTIALSGSADYESSNSTESRIAAVQAMVDKYSIAPCELKFQSVRPQCAPSTLLITGTTGALGSHLLCQTAHDSKVQRIYALGRASCNAQLQEKQKASLESRGLPSDFLSDPKVLMVAAETWDDVPAETLKEVQSVHHSVQSQRLR